jgi:pentose-5-phosphate-3-epimerase
MEEDTLGFMVRNPTHLGRTIDNLNDEVRQITLHYESVVTVLEKIKEIKVVACLCLEDPRGVRR